MTCKACDAAREREGQPQRVGDPCDICDDTGVDFLGRACRHCAAVDDVGPRCGFG